MREMLAARLHDVGEDMVVEKIPAPTVSGQDVRIRIEACNLVPNLKNILRNWTQWNPHLPLPKLPAVFGLDAAGVIDAVGEHVVHWKPGDRVYINPALGCGSCQACRHGDETACADYIFMGYFGFGPGSQRLFDAYPLGGLAQYTIAPQRAVIALPDNVLFEEAARFGYLGTSFEALHRSEAGPGDTILIAGVTGTLGLGAAVNALALNVGKILGFARNRDLLEKVRAIAPDRIQVFSSDDGLPSEWARQANGGKGVDAVINCLGPGSPPEAVVDSVNALRRGGKFVNIGGTSGPVPLDIFSMMAAQIDLIGSNWFTSKRGQEMADLAGLGRLDLSWMQHERFDLADVNRALIGMEERNGGFTNVIVRPNSHMP